MSAQSAESPPNRAAPASRLTRHGWLAAALLGFIVFLPALGHRFTYDDQAIIVENPRIRRFDVPAWYLATSWWGPRPGDFLYRPATMASYAINYAAGGLKPFGYHLVNNLLHALNCALLWWLVRLIAGNAARAIAAATAAALLFAVHAVHVEAVAGVVGRAELLMTAGYLLALIAARRSQQAVRLAGRWGWALAVLPAALLAALSKEHGVTLPAAIALLTLAPPATNRPTGGAAPGARRSPDPADAGSWRRRLGAVLPGLTMALLAAILYLLARRWVLGAWLMPEGSTIPSSDNPLALLAGGARIAAALSVLLRIGGLLLFPLRPSPNYGVAVLNPQALAESWTWPLGLVLLILTGWGLLALRRRGPIRFGLGWLMVTLALPSNLLILTGVILAERLLYLPSAAVCLLAGSTLFDVKLARPGRAAVLSLTVWGIGLAVLTLIYLPHWRDNRTLLAYALRRVPQCANVQLWNALQSRYDGRLDEALRAVDNAIRIDPTSLTNEMWRAVLLAQLGRPGALSALERVHSLNPGMPVVNHELARLLTAAGQKGRAERILVEGVRKTPDAIASWLALGDWMTRQGRKEEADRVYRRLEGGLLTPEEIAEAAHILGVPRPERPAR